MGAVGGATKRVGLGDGMEVGRRYLSHRALCLSPSCALCCLQPTNFTNPVYATLYMGGHGSRHSLASTDEKRELLGRGPEDEIGDPLA